VVVIGASIQILGAGFLFFFEDSKSPDELVAEQEEARKEHVCT
jgi:hypothetical protein